MCETVKHQQSTATLWQWTCYEVSCVVRFVLYTSTILWFDFLPHRGVDGSLLLVVFWYCYFTAPYRIHQYQSFAWAETFSWKSLVVHSIEELNKHAWPEPIAHVGEQICIHIEGTGRQLANRGQCSQAATTDQRCYLSSRLWESCIQLKSYDFPVLLKYDPSLTHGLDLH